MKMAFSTTRKCFGRYVCKYITTDIRSCLSATPTFVCFSIMEGADRVRNVYNET